MAAFAAVVALLRLLVRQPPSLAASFAPDGEAVTPVATQPAASAEATP
jgi:hypothetical protein